MAYSSKYTEEVLNKKKKKSSYAESVLDGTYESKVFSKEKSEKSSISDTTELPRANTKPSSTLNKIQNSNMSSVQKQSVLKALENSNSNNSSMLSSTKVIQEQGNGKVEDVEYLKKELGTNNKYLQKSNAFKDGYQFGDLSKTVVSTGADVATNVGKGIMNIGEGIGDLATYGIAGVADLVGKDEYAEKLRYNASHMNVVDQITKPVTEAVDKNSILGNKSDNISQGLGYVAGNTAMAIATGGLGTKLGISSKVAQTAGSMGTTFSSSMGNNMSEAYRNGATDDEAFAYGLISAAGETGSELLFGGLGKASKAIGLSKGAGALDDAVIGGLTKNIKNKMAKTLVQSGLKAGGEGAEEVMSGFITAVGKKATYMSEEELGKILADENLAEQFWMGALTSAIAQGPSTISSIKNNTDYITGEKLAETQNEINNQDNTEGTAQLNDMLNNKELPMQSYIYENSDNVKINNLRQDANRYFNNTEKAHNYVQMLEQIIQDKNINIRLDGNLKTKDGKVANGSYSNGTITINPNSTKAGEFIVIHELTHAIGTKSMMNMVDDYRKSNAEFNSAVESLLQNYNTTELTEEALSDVSAQLFGNQEFINNIANTNPGFFQKIYNEIKYLWHQFRGYKNQNQFVEDLYYKWTQAYNSNNKLNEETKYSIAGIKGMNNAVMQDTQNIVIEKSYNKALQMAKNNVDNETIRKTTNWFQDKNGDWKFEFSDKDMSLKNVKFKEGKTYKLGDILQHDTLFVVYPELKDYNVAFKDKKKGNGSFNRLTKNITLNSKLIGKKVSLQGTLIHEIQHAIQNIEGFERGGSSARSKLAYYNKLGEIEADDTKQRYLKERRGNLSRDLEAPESSKMNPQHSQLSNYLKNRNLLDKAKDNVYNYFKNRDLKGDNNEEDYTGYEESDNKDSRETNRLDLVGRVDEKVNETNQENSDRDRSLVVGGVNNNWQEHLDKNFNPTGKRTNLKDITLPTVKNNVAPSAGNNVAPSLQNNVAERAKKTENQRKAEEYEKIAEILNEPITKEKEKSRIFAIAKANLIDKGIVFEELSRKAGNNRELQGKWDYTLTAEARGQNAIGNARYERNSKTKTEKQICKSLEDIRKEVGTKTHDFQQYMYHQLNIDRMTLEERFAGDTGTNYERKDVIKNKPVFGKSVTAEISRKIVAQYEKSNPEFKNWAQDVYDFLDANKKELADRGVISQELSDKLTELYPHYVPIKRINAKGMAIKVPLDTNRTGVNSPLAKATGGNSDIQPLFQTIADRTMQTYRASARNNFGVELMNTLNSVTETSKTDVDTILEEVGDADANTELLKEGKNGNNPTFTVFNNGEKVTFEITKDMYDALKPQSEIIKNINNSKVSKVLNKISNFRRGVLTEYNPVFSLTNPIKDVQDVVINSQHPAKTYAKFPEAYAQMIKKGYWYNEYVQNGGKQNSYFKDGDFVGDKKSSRLKSAIKIPFNLVSNINNAIEMAPRLAEYIASREAGISIETSMLDAARVTTNFKAGGDFTKTLNRNGVTFLNASVQGMQQQIRNIQEANVKGLKGYAVLAIKYAIAGLPVVLLNGLLWKDDEDYEELQDYVKDNYYVIAKYGDGKFIRIPKGRVSATIQKVVGNATEYITEDKELNIDNIGKDFWEDLKFTQDNLAPNNPLDNNVLSPIIQTITNTSWYGEDIVPSRLKDKPAEEQYDESIDSFSIRLGGILGISPYKINYLLDQYGGGISDIVLPMMTKQAENNMFADKFTTDSVMKSKHPGEFYNSLDELKVKANSSKATDEDIIKYKYISSISSEMSELYNEKREIQNSNESDKEKKEKLKVVQKEINEIAKEAVKNNSNIKISENTATINDTQFYKAPSVSDGTMKWNKVSDEEKEKNKNISLKSYADYKNKIANETIKQRKNGTISSEGQLKNKDKIQIVLNSTYTNKEKSAIYENYIKDKDDQKYDIVMSSYTTTDKLNIDKYLQYKLAEANGEFDSDKKDDGTVNGKSVYGSAKEKRWNYIENMDITYTQKLILWGLEYIPSDYQQKQIVTYINAMPNKTQKEKLEILSHFKGFTIYKNGKFSY